MPVTTLTEMVSQAAYPTSTDRKQKKEEKTPVPSKDTKGSPENTAEAMNEAYQHTWTPGANTEDASTVGESRPDPLEWADKQIEAIKRAFRKKQNRGYNAVADMIQLASACTISQVKAIRGRVMRQYIQLKGGGGSRTALAAMRRVIGKAGTKIKRLKVENALKSKKKMAQRLQEKEKEKKLQNMLENRRRKRKQKEYNDILDELRSPRGQYEENESGTETGPILSAPSDIVAESVDISAAAAPEAIPEGSIDILL